MFLTMALFRLAVTLGSLCPNGLYRHCEEQAQPPQASTPLFNPHVQSSPSAYRLSFRQTGEGANTMTWPRVTTPENGTVSMAACNEDKAGRPHMWKMLVRHCGTIGGKAALEVRLHGTSKGKDCEYLTKALVPLGQEKVLALGGNTPEPLCLSVRAERVPSCERVGVNFAAPGAVCPAPVCVPAQAHTQATRECLPAPMPVASWRATMPPPAPVTFNAPVLPQPAPFYSFPFGMPQPVQVPLTMTAPVCPVAVQAIPPSPVFCPGALRGGKKAHLVKEGGKARVQLCGAGTSSEATRMTVEEGLCGKLKLAAGKKYVHVSGEKWKARADKVELTLDGRVLLEGHVRLSCDRFGEGSTVTGEKVGLRVQNGRFIELVR